MPYLIGDLQGCPLLFEIEIRYPIYTPKEFRIPRGLLSFSGVWLEKFLSNPLSILCHRLFLEPHISV